MVARRSSFSFVPGPDLLSQELKSPPVVSRHSKSIMNIGPKNREAAHYKPVGKLPYFFKKSKLNRLMAKSWQGYQGPGARAQPTDTSPVSPHWLAES